MSGESYFEYFFSEKARYLVVSFKGSMSKAAVPKLEQCLTEISAKEVDQVILNFHEVPDIQLPSLAVVIRMQAAIRKKPAKLALCHLQADLMQLLDGKGGVRRTEVYATLREALAGLKA